MNRNLTILFILRFICSSCLFAQTDADTTAIKNQLEAILDRDQKTRTGKDSAAFMHYKGMRYAVDTEKSSMDLTGDAVTFIISNNTR